MDDSFQSRAARRRSWPGSVLDHQTPAQHSDVRARLESMEQLALDAMAARGEPVVRYPRSQLPGRVLVRE